MFVVLDKDGKEVFDRYESGPTGGYLPEEWMGNLSGLDLVHNHPSGLRPERNGFGTSFSIDDITTACAQNLGSISAVSERRIYIMKPGPSGWPAPIDVWDAFNVEHSRRRNLFLAKIHSGRITIDQADMMHNDMVWKRIAKSLRMEYSVVRRS